MSWKSDDMAPRIDGPTSIFPGRPYRSALSVEHIAILRDDGTCFRPPEEGDKSARSLVRGPALKQHRILPDRRIEVLRHHPARAGFGSRQLRQRDEAEFGVAGFDELVGLGD